MIVDIIFYGGIIAFMLWYIIDFFNDVTGVTERRQKDEWISKAREREQNLDYTKSAELYDLAGETAQAGRVRRKMYDERKVDQTVVHGKVVHGNYVDDRDTIVKDSVINRSNLGPSSPKMQELKDLAEMKKEGLISDEEFEKMKKKIIR